MKKFLFFWILVLLCSYIQAGIVGNNSMNIGTSARVAGMGYAFTGVADDGAAIEYNPAGLYKINQYYVSMMHLNLGPDVMYEYVNGAMDTRYGTFGAGLSFIHLGEEEDATTTFDYFDFISSLAFSRKFYKEFSAGTTIKFFTSSIGEHSASTVFLDMGVLYGFRFLNFTGLNMPNFFVGACIKNLGPRLEYGAVTESLPVVHRYGIGYKISDTMTIASDLIKEAGFPVKYGFGVENITGKIINLRLGYQGGKVKKSFGGGIGLLIKIKEFLATFDFTYLIENAMDSSMYFTVSFQKTPPSMKKFGFETEIIFKEKIIEKEKVTIITQEKITKPESEETEKTTIVTQEKIIEKPVEKITIVTQKIEGPPEITVITQIIEGDPIITVVTQQKVTILTQKRIIDITKELDSIVVIVLNFENTGNSEKWEFLSKSIADSVSSTIAGYDFITVISRIILGESIRKSGIRQEDLYKIENLSKIGAQLEANVIVKGSFIEINRQLRITTEVFDLETGTIFASTKVLGEVGANMFDLMDKTAEAIVKDLKEYKEK